MNDENNTINEQIDSIDNSLSSSGIFHKAPGHARKALDHARLEALALARMAWRRP